MIDDIFYLISIHPISRLLFGPGPGTRSTATLYPRHSPVSDEPRPRHTSQPVSRARGRFFAPQCALKLSENGKNGRWVLTGWHPVASLPVTDRLRTGYGPLSAVNTLLSPLPLLKIILLLKQDYDIGVVLVRDWSITSE